MRAFFARFLKPGSFGRWLVSGFYRNPIRFPVALYRSTIATKKLTGNLYPIRVRIGIGQNLRILMGEKSAVKLIGTLQVNSWGGSNIASSISCSSESSLTILGDFEIGPNVHFQLARGAKLTLGGKKNSSGSGITCNSRIMVEDSLNIGCDCIIAWDVYISDSDWHDVSGVARCSPVSIGDHVWVSHGVSVLRGSVIPSGCIIGAKSLVANVFDTENALIAGVPAKVIRNGVEWAR
jgi:acetyltransferase-like isoleucine patch superfamily enzyme